MSTDLLAEVARLEVAPPVRATAHALEELVDRADAEGDLHAGVAARQALVDALYWLDDDMGQWSPFSWVLARSDEQHPWFDEDRLLRQLWHFKWVVGSLVRNPDVPLDRTEAVLADMAERYARAGQGQRPVLRLRQTVDDHVHGAVAGHDAWLRTVASPRTDLTDCAGCEPSADAAHLVALGDATAALEAAWPVLDGEVGCSEQPHAVLERVLPLLAQHGHADRAAREHVRAVRLLRGRENVRWTLPTHVLVCARSGRLARGLDLLEDAHVLLSPAATPFHRMRLAAAGARLLRAVVDAGASEEPVTLAGRTAGAGEHVTALHAEATALAGRFDARNGTSTVSADVCGWLDAPSLPDLPLDRVRVRARSHPALHGPAAGSRDGSRPVGRHGPDRHAGGADGPASGGPVTAPPVAVLLERYRRTGRDQDRRGLAAALAGGPDTGQEPADGSAVRTAAELWVLTADVDDASLPRVEALLDTFGADEPTEALVLRCWLASRPGQPAPRPVAEALLARADGCEDAGRAASARMFLAHHPAHAEGAARLLALARAGFERSGPDALPWPQRGHAARLLVEAAAELEPDAALELLARAEAFVPAGSRCLERALVHRARAGALLDRLHEHHYDHDHDGPDADDAYSEAEHLRGAVEDAATEAAVEAAEAGEPLLEADALGLLLHVAPDEDAPGLLDRLVRLLGRHGSLAARVAAERRLVWALLDDDRPEEAAEQAEAALDAVGGHPAAPEAEADGALDGELGPLAFVAGLAAQRIGDDAAAARHLRVSAEHHVRRGTTAGAAEALLLAAGSTPVATDRVAVLDEAARLADESGEPALAAEARRRRAQALVDADGPDAALGALAEARSLLADADDPVGLPEGWRDRSRLQLAAERVRVLAWAADDAVVEEATAVAAEATATEDTDVAEDMVVVVVDTLVQQDEGRRAVVYAEDWLAVAADQGWDTATVGLALARALDDIGDEASARRAFEHWCC